MSDFDDLDDLDNIDDFLLEAATQAEARLAQPGHRQSPQAAKRRWTHTLQDDGKAFQDEIEDDDLLHVAFNAHRIKNSVTSGKVNFSNAFRAPLSMKAKGKPPNSEAPDENFLDLGVFARPAKSSSSRQTNTVHLPRTNPNLTGMLRYQPFRL